MANGKQAKAPCGHDGEYVIGQFIRCSKGCDDAVPEFIEEEKTLPLCLHNNTLVTPGFNYPQRWCYDCRKYLGSL
jgi:hypothetical protein